VIWDKILFEAKAVEKLTDAHVKQVLNYLARPSCGLVCWSTSAAIRWSGSALFCKFVLIRGIRVSMNSYHLDHLQYLETEAIHVMREVAAEFERPALLFSGAKTPFACCAWRKRPFGRRTSPCRSSRRYRPCIFPN